MEKDCKLQLCRIKAGPFPTSGKLRLVDEFNKATTFHVIPWPSYGPLETAEVVGRAVLAGPLVDKVDELLTLAMTGVENPSLPILVSLLVALELASLGSSKFTRSSYAGDKTYDVIDEIQITRDQYMIAREEIPKKKKFYSALFNNCLHQTRREFDHYKERFSVEPLADVREPG